MADSPTSPSPLRVGELLAGKYRVERVLGRSGMGVVYLAEHIALERQVAIKFLLAAADASGELRERFRREAKVLAKLETPHVVRVFDVGVIDSVGPYIVMEYLEGEDLAQILKRERSLSVERACALLFQAAKGLAAAHAEGIVHRDVKPGNLFVIRDEDGSDVVKVIDFGIAKMGDSIDGSHAITQTESLMGSPRYMSPEQLRDPMSTDARSDVWSLGITLYEALTGAPPFRGDSLPQLMFSILDEDAPPLALVLPRVPAGLQPVIDDALEKDRARRTGSASAFARSLAPFSGAAATRIASASIPHESTPEHDERTTVATRVPSMPRVASPDADARTRVTPGRTRHSLPAEPNPFIGRQSDIDALTARIEAGARLVTLLGIGGTGKTRLATHYGWESLERFPGGVWFCDLSDARTIDGITFGVASAMGVPLGKEDAVTQLAHAIIGRGRCLVILDNFEQLTSDARPTLGVWLERAEEARFIVTSREVLGLPGEQTMPLDPLERNEAIALFEARAGVAKPGFALAEHDRPVAEALVALLDQLPLAIELAAARVRVMSVATILERMRDRFKLLTTASGRRARQATLRGALDWSWDLLSAEERAALAQLSVFEGGFTLEAAEAVLSLDELWPVDAVQSLVDKSLVRRTSADRFGLLVSVHEYASEKLDLSGERESTEERHGAHFARCGTASAIEALDSHGGTLRLRALALDIDNLAIATKRAVARRDAITSGQGALAAWTVLELKGPYAVGISLLEAALSVADPPSTLRGSLLTSLGAACRDSGDVDRASSYLEAALAHCKAYGERRAEGAALRHFGSLLWEQGRLEQARARFDEALAIDRAVQNRSEEAMLLNNVGLVSLERGKFDEAALFFEQSLSLQRSLGHRKYEGAALANLGAISHTEGQLELACERYESAIRIYREGDHPRLEAISLCNLGQALGSLQRFELAAQALGEALSIFRQLGSRRGEGIALSELGSLHKEHGSRGEALGHYEQAEERLRTVNDRYQVCLLLASRAELEATHDAERASADLTEALAIATEIGVGAESEPMQRIRKAQAALGSP